MKHTFTYDQGTFETLSITSMHGVKVVIGFKDGSPIYVDLDGQGHEIEPTDDLLNGLFIAFAKGSLEVETFSLAQILAQAEKDIDKYRSDYETESRDWDRHVKSYSQPSL